MSQRYFQGVESATIPASLEGGSNYSGVYTLDQLNRLNAVYPAHIANSLRFRSSASAYLSRTPGVATNRKTWTWSGWLKRGDVAGSNRGFIFTQAVAGSAGNQFFSIEFEQSGGSAAANDIYIQNYDNGTVGLNFRTSAVYRDPSAWYHLVLAVDTTQATSTNRVKLYINGSQVTAFSTANYPSQNFDTFVNSANIFCHGALGGTSLVTFDGYLADINFIDGQALTPSAFGQFYYETGVWCPMPYQGTYGTNGFRLNFSNGTSTTTLGYDSSGNGNNWTTNNISLTAGSTYDWMIDSPTSFAGSSYGVGNYAVLNPIYMGSSASKTYSVSDGNLTAVSGTSGQAGTLSTISVASGKWYSEITATNNGTNSYIFVLANGVAYSISATGNGVVVGIALDMDAGSVTFYKNNVSQGTQTGITGSAFVGVDTNAWGSGAVTYAANFGQRPFAYTPPSGYKSLCTQNLTTPTVPNGANYMAATTYTGTGATQSISNAVNGVIFQPDFVWIKDRSVGASHNLFDSIRGVRDHLSSNLTDAEYTEAAGYSLTAFNSNGFALGLDNAGSGRTNANGDTFVGWQWKAGGTAVTNTAGSITSQVSANTTAGFSVVTYTGTGANATVGHGLGVAPSMVIVKARANATGWVVGHAYLNAGSSPWNYYLSLESTAAQGSTNLTWNNTAPTSSVFSLGSGSGTNPASTMVAYCFAAIAGYSAFGSYTGNGSADGPFVYLGFRPRYVLVKRSDSAEQWDAFDSARYPANTSTTPTLSPNSSAAEVNSYLEIDILSNGFKVKSTGTGTNASGGSYIYAAFAENPFNYSLAR